MDPKVRRLYKEALKNDEFNKQFREADEGYCRPNFFTDDINKVLYTLVYEGWLIARGEFIESKYE